MLSRGSEVSNPAFALLVAALWPCSIQAASTALKSFRCGEVAISVQETRRNEYVESRVSFGGKDQRELYPDVIWAGQVRSLCARGSILLVDTNTQHKQLSSFLMSKDLRVIARFDFGEIASIEVSTDESLFWVQTRLLKDGTPRTRLRVFDAAGKPVLDRLYGDKKQEAVSFGGRTYTIDVLAPDFPG